MKTRVRGRPGSDMRKNLKGEGGGAGRWSKKKRAPSGERDRAPEQKGGLKDTEGGKWS